MRFTNGSVCCRSRCISKAFLAWENRWERPNCCSLSRRIRNSARLPPRVPSPIFGRSPTTAWDKLSKRAMAGPHSSQAGGRSSIPARSLEIRARHADGYAGTIHRRQKNPSPPHSWTSRQQYSCTPLPNDSYPGCAYSSVGSPERRPLRSTQRGAKRIRRADSGLVLNKAAERSTANGHSITPHHYLCQMESSAVSAAFLGEPGAKKLVLLPLLRFPINHATLHHEIHLLHHRHIAQRITWNNHD